KAEAIGAEVDRDGDGIAAVAVEQQRRRSVMSDIAASDQRNRDLGAVRRGGVDALADVLVGVAATENALLLQELAFSSLRIVIEHRCGRDEGLVVEANFGRLELGIGAKGGVVGWLGEFDSMTRIDCTALGSDVRRGLGEINDAQIRKAAFTFESDN